MAVDLAALKAELEDPRYDAAVTSSKNRDILALLGEDVPGQMVFRAVPAQDVREAVGDGVRSLTAVQVQILRLFAGGDGDVDFTRAAIRDEIQQLFIETPLSRWTLSKLFPNRPVLARLQALVTRNRRYCDSCGGMPTLRDLWAALRQIPKSYMAQYFARG